MASQTAKDILSQEVANYGVLFVKLHNYHWYVSGPHFFTYHEKLEELYNLVAVLYDEAAERLLMHGGKPAATMKENLKMATVQEGDSTLSTKEMIEDIINDFRNISKEMKTAIESFTDEDDTIEDTLVGHLEQLEKEIWMLESTIEK